MDLYVMDTCPFCRKVMDFMEQEHIEYNKKDIYELKNHEMLLQIGGVEQVPFLVDGSVKMYESADIIEYLKNKK